ncbi:MAG: class I SAM-dependent methyltransferase [Clostridia bacterium]|nr:class I SAM-dependent methyltransferase [Clostridia bacterium]
MSEVYVDFAQVYDTFMDETPYEEWCDYLMELIQTYGISRPAALQSVSSQSDASISNSADVNEEQHIVLDLGCGTGTLTELMASKGYDMIGIDCSPQMLRLAKEKSIAAEHKTLYLLQDMREMELYGTIGTVISVCDSLNYLLTEEDLIRTFRLVNNYLYPNGIFIFDFNTVYKYEQVIGDTTIAENREACSFIWENYYDEESQINEYDVTVFVRENEDLYRRFEEIHMQRGYTIEQMEHCLEQAGLKFVMSMDADSHGQITEQSERIYVIARENGKQNG